MRYRRTVFCIVVSLLGIVLDVSVLPYTGLNTAYLPRFCLVNIVLIGSILGITPGLLCGAVTGILLDVTVYSPTGLVAAIYTVCGLGSALISSHSRAALVTVVPSIASLGLFELAMLITYFFSCGTFPTEKLLPALIRIGIAFVVIQILYIPFVRILKPASIGSLYGSRRRIKKEYR